MPAEVVATEQLGHTVAVRMLTSMGQRVVATRTGVPPRIGTVRDVGFRPDRVHHFDAVTGHARHHPTP
jgi:hypothetical protein